MDDATQLIRIVIDSSAARQGADETKRALQGIEEQSTRTAASVEKIQGSLGGLGDYARVFIGLKIGEYIGHIAHEALAAAAGLHKLSEQLGVSVDFLQASKAAALEQGVSLQNLETGFSRFSRTVGLASEGNKASIELFEKMGVKILDAGGHLRSTDSIMVDFAKSITRIEDPAVKGADAVAAMGRGGQRLLPMFAGMAEGGDSFTASMAKMGTFLTSDTIERLHQLEIQSEKTKLKLEATFANNIAEPLTNSLNWARDKLAEFITWQSAAESAKRRASSDAWIDNLAASMIGIDAAMGKALTSIGALTASIFTNVMNSIIGVINAGLRTITTGLNELLKAFPGVAKFYGVAGGIAAPSIAPLPGDGNAAPLDGYFAGIGQAYAAGKERAAGQIAFDNARNRPNTDFLALNDPQGQGGALPSPAGVSNPGIKGHGSNRNSLQSTLDRLREGADLGLASAVDVAAAADRGADAVARLENKTKDLKAVTDAYIASNKGNKELSEAQRAAIEAESAAITKKTEATRELHNLTKFVLATNDLKDQNGLTALQYSLTGSTSEEIARQVEQQKALNQLRKDGVLALAEAGNEGAKKAVADRATAIDQQYKIKTAIDETAKSSQLWTAPFSQAIGSISSAFTGFFETIFKGGTVTWQSMADTFKGIFIKMLAELAVLSVVRPILGGIVSSLFTPGAAQSLGFAGGGGIGGLGAILSPIGSLLFGAGGSGGGGGGFANQADTGRSYGSIDQLIASGAASPAGGSSGGGLFGNIGAGIGLGSLFSGGSGGGFFSSILNTPIFGGAPAGDGIGRLIDGLGLGAGGGLLNGGSLSIGGALGGLGSIFGIGMGINTLLSGKGSTKSTISGIGGILGGGLGLAGLLTGSAALGPIGLAVGIGSMLLGSLLGGGEEKPFPASAYSGGNLMFDTADGGFNTWGSGNNGGSSLAGQLKPYGKSIADLVKAAGGRFVPGRTYGLALGTNTNDAQNSQQFGVTGDILTPGGGSIRSFDNIKGQQFGPLAEMLASFAWGLNIAHGGVEGVSPTLKQATLNREQINGSFVGSFSLIQRDIDMAASYENLGKETTSAETKIKQITDSFKNLTAWAQEVGISLDPITKEQTAQTLKVASDFMTTIGQGIKGITDPLGAQIDAIKKAGETAAKEAAFMSASIKGSFIDMAQVAQYYTLQEQQARKQFYASDVAALQAAIQNLTYGSLSGASPRDTLAGSKATYAATLAQATAGDRAAIARLSGDATSYVQAGQAFYGSSADYQKLIAEVRAALATEQATLQAGGPNASPSVSTAAVNDVLASNATLSAQITALMESVQRLTAQNLDLTQQMQRLAANQRAA